MRLDLVEQRSRLVATARIADLAAGSGRGLQRTFESIFSAASWSALASAQALTITVYQMCTGLLSRN